MEECIEVNLFTKNLTEEEKKLGGRSSSTIIVNGNSARKPVDPITIDSQSLDVNSLAELARSLRKRMRSSSIPFSKLSANNSAEK